MKGKCEKSKKPFYKKVWFWAVILILCVFSLFGKKESQPSEQNIPDQSKASFHISSTDPKTQKESETEEAIKDIILTVYAEEQLSSLIIENGSLEIKIILDCSFKNRPDDWSDITNTAQSICRQVADSEENTCQNTAVRILGKGNENLLNVLNGEITYDRFANQEEENHQDGTSSSSKPASSNSRDYVLNTNTMKFHYPRCSSVSDIKTENRENYSGSRDTLISRGYSPCGRCHP